MRLKKACEHDLYDEHDNCPGGEFVELEPEYDHEGVMELAAFGRREPLYHIGRPLRRFVTRWERYD